LSMGKSTITKCIRAFPEGMAVCPVCRKESIEVDGITVGNHVREAFWPLHNHKFFVCENPGCDVVYFSESGYKVLMRADVKTRVTFKERDAPRPLCYCKQVTEEDVIASIEKGARSFEEVKLATGIGGGGQCRITNPAGKCCSRNYKPFIEKELAKKGKRSEGVQQRLEG
jgi:bacterioferritin-associated ferredoxin